ncbi:amino acid ABC transporter permease [Methanofollis formosanus]|uniref:Amino acid ABC transporter permease n=1 Tax=Methanofollis formosanus TaxID=299308 RepID=A0A8G1A222_9EURY|nr:amino acid ABC transporter permease [Methanofollis formosanus]QYZ79747.1 amino acid ABC transporter permease [Methanofollis formosanus]
MDVITILVDWFPYLFEGIVQTLALVLASLSLGLLFGLPMALGQIYGSRVLQSVISVYVWFFRGLPVLVLLFLFFFGIFPTLNLDISPFLVAVVVLGLRGAAYQSQIFRGAILSISEGQMIAARSLGMTRMQAIRSIILPQAVRIALPGWSNEYPTVLTDTSVCYAIGVAEILTRTTHIVAQTYIAMPIYLAAAGIYILLNYAGMKGLHILEKRISIPGFGQGGV